MVRPISPTAQTFPAVACKTACFNAFHRHNCAHVSSGKNGHCPPAARVGGLRHPAPPSPDWRTPAGCGPESIQSSRCSRPDTSFRPRPNNKSTDRSRAITEATRLHRAAGDMDSPRPLVRGKQARVVDEPAFDCNSNVCSHDAPRDVRAANRQPAGAMGGLGITPRLCTANDRR